MNEWREYSLGEIYEFASGLSKSADQFGFGFEFLTFKDVFDNFFLPAKLSSLANTTEKERIRCSIKAGDVFLTRTSETQEELGMSSVALKDYPNATFNGFTKRLRPKEPGKVLPEYAGYYFRSPRFRAAVTSMSSITTRASLNNDMLAALKIVVPPIETQKLIAGVLKPIDDKIDLLHRQNATLEAMAETLFRQWFVEEAKEESNNHIFLGDLIETVSVTHKFPSDHVVFLNTSDAYLGEVLNHTPVAVKGLPGQAKKTIRKNDILFSEIRPANGRYAFVDFDADNYVVSTKFMVLRAKNGGNQAFTYFYLTNSMTTEWLQMLAESRSGTFPQITFDQLRDLKVNLPSEEVFRATIDWCQSALAKIKANQRQIRTLKGLRDVLLPRLMTGEVRIKDFA